MRITGHMWPMCHPAMSKLALPGPAWPCKDGHMSTGDLERLASAVRARRLALGLARKTAAGVAPDTWKRIESGQRLRAMSYAKVDQALNWAVGSCEAILAGGEPTLIEPSQADPKTTLADVSDATRGAAVKRIVESASIATTDSLSAAEIRELAARVAEDLAREGII